MREIIDRESAVRARGSQRRAGQGRVRRSALQDRIDRRAGEGRLRRVRQSVEGEARHLVLPRRRVRRSVPRPARGQHGQDQPQGHQVDERGGRVLARRRKEQDAAAHLRHGLGIGRRSQRLSRSVGRSQEARSSQAGQRPRPVLVLRRHRPGPAALHAQRRDSAP